MHWCHTHEPKINGADDEAVSLEGVNSYGDINPEANRAVCEAVHRGRR